MEAAAAHGKKGANRLNAILMVTTAGERQWVEWAWRSNRS